MMHENAENAEDDETTHEIVPPRLLPPVRSPEELPTEGDLQEGTLCLVTDETGDEQLWAFHDGEWMRTR